MSTTKTLTGSIYIDAGDDELTPMLSLSKDIPLEGKNPATLTNPHKTL